MTRKQVTLGLSLTNTVVKGLNRALRGIPFFVLAPVFCVISRLSVHVYNSPCCLLSNYFWSCISLDKKDPKTFGIEAKSENGLVAVCNYFLVSK